MKLKIAQWKPSQITPNAGNARKHPPKQIAQIRASIREFGFVNPLIVQANGDLIAGHGRFEAGQLEGLETFPVIVLDHLTEAQAEALRLADNRIAENATWDDEKLSAALGNLKRLDFDIGKIGFAGAELKRLVQFEAGQSEKDDGDGDDEQSKSTPPTARRGDVYALGNHRLVCGDSFSVDDRATLFKAGTVTPSCVVTDPPFAIYGSSSGLSSDIADDKMIRPFFEAFWRACFDHLPNFAHVYACCDWRSWSTLWETCKAAKMTAKNMLVWDKGGSGLGSNYANTHELVFFAHKLPPETTMRGTSTERGIRTINKPNVFHYNRPHGDERQHNAAKPVDMLREFIEGSTEAGAIVWEPFAGSGSTLIACELTGRNCYAMEMEPRMCDVIVRRWEKRTGKKAELESTTT